MSRDQLSIIPSKLDAPPERRVLVDAILLEDVRGFLHELRRLTGQMELVVDQLADTILRDGGPAGRDPTLRNFLIRLLAAEASGTSRSVHELDPRQVVTHDLFDRQAELEACLDPLIGQGALTERAAGLLLAMIVPAASRSHADGRAPITWHGISLSTDQLRNVGVPLLGATFGGYAPFRLLRGGDLARGHLSSAPQVVWNLLELARSISVSEDHGLVLVPHLDSFEDRAAERAA